MNAWLHANNYHPPAHDFQFVKNKPTLNDANEIREEVEAMQRLKYKILSNPSEEAMTTSDESFEDDEYKTKDDSVDMLLFTVFLSTFVIDIMLRPYIIPGQSAVLLFFS